jgi:NAD(P)-dependent dehydrogenase (short-subunit alcohol dehydrogenase family)
MVTGATAGIGEVTALELARLGAAVILVSRNPEKCARTAARIREETGNRAVDYFAVDLSSQSQIRQFARQFLEKYPRLEVLVNNAGAFFLNRQLSVDGIEMTFALNHLNYFLLTYLLLDTLKASAPARIVNVSSNAHFNAALDFDDLQFAHGYSAFKAYGRSKFANLLFTYELDHRLEGTGVTANALHPGLVQTDIGRSAGRWLGWAWKIMTLFRKGLTPEQGARTSIYLASSPEVRGVSGKYYDQQKAVPSDPGTYDRDASQRLWEISEQMVGLKEG